MSTIEVGDLVTIGHIFAVKGRYRRLDFFFGDGIETKGLEDGLNGLSSTFTYAQHICFFDRDNAAIDLHVSLHHIPVV